MQIAIPEQAAGIISALEKAGFGAYVVGGCVRDSLMGRPPADWDITTAARPEEVMACFAEYRVVETGLKHGTVTLVLDHIPYEVTTFRIDGAYSDNRRPDSVTFTGELREDLARRDFTINAMAWSPRTGLVDPFGGHEDIRRGRISCVGDPARRFGEDALRILRAVRFASVLDFTIDDDTAAAMEAARGSLDNIAVERIRVELEKALQGEGIERAFTDCASIILEVLPELGPCVGFDQKSPSHHLDVWGHSLQSVAMAARDPLMRLTMLLHDCGKPASCTAGSDGVLHFSDHAAIGAELSQKLLARLKYDNDTRLRVPRLVAHHATPIPPEQGAVRRWLNRLGEEDFRRLLQVKRADAKAHVERYAQPRLEALAEVEGVLAQVLGANQCYRLTDLAVDGKDILALGVPPGREVGAKLTALLDQVIDGGLPNDRDALLQYVRRTL